MDPEISVYKRESKHHHLLEALSCSTTLVSFREFALGVPKNILNLDLIGTSTLSKEAIYLQTEFIMANKRVCMFTPHGNFQDLPEFQRSQY